jgi:adenylosuccinate synthase
VPVYETLPGWHASLSDISRRDQLPEEAADYLTFLQGQMGVPVSMVGVGPGRAQFLHFNVVG